jgi:cellulose synthase/poly-beta-1,6-N-acetylglucosamine synthase-like glycosyltransferase
MEERQAQPDDGIMTLAFIILLGVTLVVYVSAGLFFLVGLLMPARARGTAQPFVSVLVAARNEERHLPECLQTLVSQTYPSDKVEIIVVDDRSTDGTASIVETFASRNSNIRLVRIAEKPNGVSGKKYALQRGIEQSCGEILMFIDADCTVRPTWVQSVARYFSNDVGLVIGFSSVSARSTFERFQQADFLALMAAACGAANLGHPLAASGQNLAYRRQAYDDAGGFSGILHRISGDDVIILHRIRRTGRWRIVFASDARAFTATRPAGSWRELIAQRSRWASNADMMLRMNFPFFAYLFCVYLFNALLVVGLVGSAFSPVIGLAAIFGWVNKAVIDGVVLATARRTFGIGGPVYAYVMWFFLQTPLLIWIGLMGVLKVFRWK